MVNSLTSAEQQALLWPIKAKGDVQRWNPLSDPSIETYYHKAMEGGRWLETNIADANFQLLKAQQDLYQKILIYTHMNSLAVDGQLSDTPRVPKYIADSISILQTAHQLQGELTALANAIQGNITMILAIEASMLQMVQTALNSLANLLNNICNWGIPALPSIPNLFSDTMWNWNGFQFSPLALFAALKSNTNFSFNFSFSQCSFGPTAPSDLFVANPLSTESYSGYTYGTTNYDPPFQGAAVSPSQDQTDPAFIAQMQAQTSTPVYGSNFNPNTSMLGAVPDPHTIISDWRMPAATYAADIVSICPLLRQNTVEPGDPDYSSPNLTVRNPQLRKDLLHSINLTSIVQSNFDPFVVSAWLLYLNATRQGRGGIWIPNFEATYNQYLQPSIGNLLTLSVPWNDVLGQTNYLWMGTWGDTTSYEQNDVVTFNGAKYLALSANSATEPDTDPTVWGPVPANTVYSDAPVITFTSTLQTLPTNQLNHLLWQLSYIEASLLGYTRTRAWDTNQDTAYLYGPTGADLDYVATPITATTSSLVLGSGTAEFPVPVTFPTAMKNTLDAVVALATTDIQNDVTYLSPRLGNRYTYNPFAQATMVDRFSQFWRDFASNLTAFLAQDAYLVQFAITYPEILNGALNPLGDQTAYNLLLQDVATRSRTWTPGTPLLPIPVAPVVSPLYSNSSSPTMGDNGWIDDADMNPVAFLARPDVQAQPIGVQIAMLRTNLSYAAVNKFKSRFQAEVTSQINTANALLQTTTPTGFSVSIYTTDTIVPAGTPVPVAFDPLQLPNDFDNSGNYTNPTTFTIQEAGTYNGVAQVDWQTMVADTLTITITQNNTAIAMASTTTTGAGAASVSLTFIGTFNTDDVVQVVASTSVATETVVPGSTFSMILSTAISPSPSPAQTDETRIYTADVDLTALVAVQVNSDGNVTPVDPVVPQITNVVLSGTTLTITANNDFTSDDVGGLVTFQYVGTASWLNGTTATLLTVSPTGFTAAYSPVHSPYSAADTGSVFFAADVGGDVIAPNADGVTLTSASAGASVSVTAFYGGQYVAPSATAFNVGALVYAGPNGVLTDDYATLVTQVGWIMCIGRVIAYDPAAQTVTFIYEPHVPTRFSSLV
jgi:hypothetical protein